MESAYLTVCSDKVNYFGQRCISSFLPAKRMYNRPLLVKLQAIHGSLPPLGLDLLRQVMFYSTAFLYRPSESSTSCLFRSCTNTLGVAYVVVKLVDFWWSQSGMPRASQFEAGNGKRCQERHNSCQKGELCNNCALWATTVQFALISYLEYSRLTSAWHLNVVDRF